MGAARRLIGDQPFTIRDVAAASAKGLIASRRIKCRDANDPKRKKPTREWLKAAPPKGRGPLQPQFLAEIEKARAIGIHPKYRSRPQRFFGPSREQWEKAEEHWKRGERDKAHHALGPWGLAA